MAFSVPIPDRARPVLAMLWRILLATAGAYAVASLFAAAFSLLPWLTRADQVLAATMLAFVLHCALVIAVFHAHTLVRATLVCVVPAVLLSALLYGVRP